MQFETFDSLFDALADSLADAPNLKIRFEMLSALERQILSWSVLPTIAATRLGITSSKLDDILRGKLQNFSLDTLIALTTAVDHYAHQDRYPIS